jgi:pimeloyl-ACP methyl ester carboxylesterase
MRSFRFTITVLLFYSNSVLAQTSIDTSLAVPIGGIKQWINISTKDNAKPLLLFLNGGPGESAMGARDYFTNKLQERFVVVLWDQRESGKTLQLNASPQPLTVDRYLQDTHELITDLKKAFDDLPISLFNLSNEAGKIDFAKQIPTLQCPVYLFVGRNDYQTNHDLTYSYYQQLKAKNKHFYWFEKSAHLVPFTEPDLFQQTIIDKVLPETYK